MRSSYKKEDVTILLKDITGLVQPQPTEEREKAIQTGRHYSEMLPIEYAPSKQYMEAYEVALKSFGQKTADAVAVAAKKILADPVGELKKYAVYFGDYKGLMLRWYLWPEPEYR